VPTPSHEGIGLVVALGQGVTAVQLGERVGVPWLYSACGHCEFCLAARETVCAEAQFGGYTKNGGFAEYILADPNSVDIDDGKLAHATRLGADAVVNAMHGDPIAAVRAITDGGAHGVLITAPSLVGTRKDMAEALAFAVNGRVKADIELQPLSAINSVFDRLGKGEVPSRVVLDFSKP
jgi:D-arabinose 1-dehydrogenase-like Zn-dependent alcohol dehydrogenase